jgi:hypothetical protein
MDVLPGLPVDDAMHGSFGNAVAGGERILRNAARRQSSYFPHRRLVQFCVSSPLATWDTIGIAAVGMRPRPSEHPFDLSIADVVVARSEKEVCWIDAGRIITAGAVVADEHAVWDRPNQERPGHPMGESFAGTISASASMPTGSRIRLPQPTSIVLFLDPGPEARRIACRVRLSPTGTRTETPMPAGGCLERALARRADMCILMVH